LQDVIMSFIAECPFCRVKVQHIPDDRAGASAECPRCHNLITLAPMVHPPKLRPTKSQAAILSPAPPASTAVAQPGAHLTDPVSAAEPALSSIRDNVRSQARSPTFVSSPARPPYRPALSPWALNGFGLASFVLGGLAFPAASLPYVGVMAIPLSGLGLLLGVLGLVITAPKRGGIVFPIAGLAVCLPLLAILVFWPGKFGHPYGFFTWRKPAAVPEGLVAHLPRQGRGWHVVVTEKEWVDARKGSLLQDGIGLQVTAAAVKTVQPKNPFGKASREKGLVITLQITNAGTGRPVKYTSWAEAGARLVLLDNLGKSYRRKTDPEPAGHIRSATISPGDAVEDVLVFEAPPPDIVFLSLELPGSAVGLSGALKLEIPRKLVAY
jgi:hypothetical protein